MKRSFSVVANSGHLHMYLWSELHGCIRALGFSLCQSKDFILTEASHDIARINLSSISFRIGLAFAIYIAIAFTINLSSISIRIGVAIAFTVGVAVNVAVSVAIAI